MSLYVLSTNHENRQETATPTFKVLLQIRYMLLIPKSEQYTMTA